MKRFKDKLMRKVDSIASGSSDLEATVRKGNPLPNKEKLWKESRSRVWKRIKRFPHRILKVGAVT
jgi:hypothetical protein